MDTEARIRAVRVCGCVVPERGRVPRCIRRAAEGRVSGAAGAVVMSGVEAEHVLELAAFDGQDPVSSASALDSCAPDVVRSRNGVR
jgi:hypothetical protein